MFLDQCCLHLAKWSIELVCVSNEGSEIMPQLLTVKFSLKSLGSLVSKILFIIILQGCITLTQSKHIFNE